MTITVTRIIPYTCEIFDPDGTTLGHLNELELMDLRLKIKMSKASGYYAMYNGAKIDIHPDGCIRSWPSGFYDDFDERLNLLAFGTDDEITNYLTRTMHERT